MQDYHTVEGPKNEVPVQEPGIQESLNVMIEDSPFDPNSPDPAIRTMDDIVRTEYVQASAEALVQGPTDQAAYGPIDSPSAAVLGGNGNSKAVLTKPARKGWYSTVYRLLGG